jgi:hypothetical protein
MISKLSKRFYIFEREQNLEIYQDVIVSSEELTANENWFQKNACNRAHNCQNDDSETIKKKRRTLFRRRKFDVLIEFI